MKTIIYYFSGTGNSLAVALGIADKLKEAKVVSILELKNNKKIPAEFNRIGFVYPCFYGHPPKIVLDLVSEIQINMDSKVFIIVTFGGKYTSALFDMKKQLQPLLKNIIQEFSVRLPGNHIVGYSAFPKFLQRIMFKKAPKTVAKIVNAIEQELPSVAKEPKKTVFMEKFTKFANNILGVKNVHQRKAQFFTTSSCIHCGTCEKICPVENIKISSSAVNFHDHCEQCMACIQWCPQKAITHPNIPKKRKHYHHPDIKLSDMLKR
jgi:ferredoxin/flavodoxin